MLARRSAQSEAQPDVSIRRTLFVAAFVVFWMLGISARLVYLQVSHHEKLVELAEKQQQGLDKTTPQRGSLLDRQGRELARSIDTTSVSIAPDKFDSLTDTAGAIDLTTARLAPILGINQLSLSNRIIEARTSGRGRGFIWAARQLSPEIANEIERMQLTGVHLKKEQKRFYPNGSLAANVLGFVDIDGKGLAGIELVYHEKIAGEPGKLFVEKDGKGKVYESREVPGRPGHTIVLTLDQTIQRHAEEALAKAVAQSNAKSGTAIVLDPRTGEILALANVPTFDPNDAGAASPATRSNSAVQNIYEPGSTFKVVVFSAALEKGLVKPDDKIDCQMGSITVGKRVIRDSHAFGTLTIAEALAKSSNVAAIKLGLRVGNQTMHDYMTGFGFGSRTGIELPYETAGMVRPVKRWQTSSIGSVAIGQEVGVTPLQMAAAFGALANDGVRVAPHVIREIRNASGSTIFRPNPEQRRVISKETATALRGMLEGATLNGTAKKAQLDGYSAAGKTGTAQKIDPQTKGYSKTKHVASFVGFAPVSNPAVVIIVVIDEPAGAYHGGDVAAPVFREIAEQVLPELDVMPDTDFETPVQLVARAYETPEQTSKQHNEEMRQEQSRASTMPQVAGRDSRGGEIVYAVAINKAIVMPDLRGLSVRDVVRACAQLGMQLEAHGEGSVVSQTPESGAELRTGQIIYVDFGRLN